jgi:hypothetical protein
MSRMKPGVSSKLGFHLDSISANAASALLKLVQKIIAVGWRFFPGLVVGAASLPLANIG